MKKEVIIIDGLNASVINSLKYLEECLGIKLISVDKFCEGDEYPTFHFATSKYEDDKVLDVYRNDKEWVIGLGCGISLNYKCMFEALLQLLVHLNYSDNKIDFNLIKIAFGIEEDSND